MSKSDWLVAVGIILPVLIGAIRWAMSMMEEWKRNTALTSQILELLRGNPRAFPPTIGLLARLEKLEFRVARVEEQMRASNLILSNKG